MPLIEFIRSDTEFNLARTLRETRVAGKKIEQNTKGERKSQMIFALSIYEKYREYLLTRQTPASGNPKAVNNAKMWPCRSKLANLRNEQVHFVKDG